MPMANDPLTLREHAVSCRRMAQDATELAEIKRLLSMADGLDDAAHGLEQQVVDTER